MVYKNHFDLFLHMMPEIVKKIDLSLSGFTQKQDIISVTTLFHAVEYYLFRKHKINGIYWPLRSIFSQENYKLAIFKNCILPHISGFRLKWTEKLVFTKSVGQGEPISAKISKSILSYEKKNGNPLFCPRRAPT